MNMMSYLAIKLRAEERRLAVLEAYKRKMTNGKSSPANVANMAVQPDYATGAKRGATVPPAEDTGRSGSPN